jgi:methylated-DNA-[protein]-cysteine S-methyltransferase
MKHFFDTFLTPLGIFSIATDEPGALVATAFGDEKALRDRFHPRDFARNPQACGHARRQIEEYFAGERTDFDVPLAAAGTAFQQSVWSALCRIPFGETRSYAQVAESLGKPGAARAVGRANATNPICLVVPCHRVIGANGSLTGFAFGESIKRRLLALEQSGPHCISR